MNATDQRLLTPRFALVVTVGLCYFLAIGMLLPVVPLFVHDDLLGSDLAVGVSVGAFSVGAILLRPIAGRIGDRTGRRILIVGGAFVLGSAGLLYHLATSVGALVAIRVLGGVGEAAFFVGAGTMITDLAPVERRGEAISYWSVAIYSGIAFGPLLGETILDGTHFGRVWTVSALFALAAGVLGLFTRETVGPHDPADPGPSHLLHRASIPPGVILFLGLLGLAGFVEFVPLYVEQIGLTDSQGVFLLYGCTILAVRVLGARLPDRLGPLTAGTIATGMSALGMVIVAAVAHPAGLFAGTFVFAIGMAFLYPALLTLALTGVPETERGSAVGTISSFFDLSQGLGAAMLGGVAALTGYRGAFTAGAVLIGVALLLLRAGIDPRTRRPVDHTAAELAIEQVEPDLP